MVTEIFLLKLEIRSHKIEENSIGALPFFYKQLPQVETWITLPGPVGFESVRYMGSVMI